MKTLKSEKTDDACDQRINLIDFYVHNDVGETWIENVKQTTLIGMN